MSVISSPNILEMFPLLISSMIKTQLSLPTHRSDLFQAVARYQQTVISVGGMGVVAGFVILSYYAVVAGWTIGYLVEAIKGVFNNFSSAADAEIHFNNLVGNVNWMMGYYTLFFVLTMAVVYMGVKNGIERGRQRRAAHLLPSIQASEARGDSLIFQGGLSQ